MRGDLLTKRRAEAVFLSHPLQGNIRLSDNIPLSETKLAKILDDNLTPADWLGMLNARVFLFPSETPLLRLVRARENREKTKDILVVDTKALAIRHGDAIDISPINTGNTNHQPARRGLATFAPLLNTDYPAWQRCRPKKTPDTVKEVSVRRSVLDISAFVIEIVRGEAVA